LEERAGCPISHIIAARLYGPIQKEISHQKVWLKLDDGIEISETQYQNINRSKARRMVIVRQKIQDRPKATGRQLRLFQDRDLYNQYRYHCFIMNLALPAIQS